MNCLTILRIACVGVSASLAVTSPAISATQAVADRPAGWAVAAAPADPELAKLSEEQLINRLQQAEPATGPWEGSIEPFWPIGGAITLTGGIVSMRVDSPAMVELVRRGCRALPALLDHLTDARPTKLAYVVSKPVASRKTSLAFGDEYDPRVNGATPAGVNTGERTPLDDSGIYTFRVGDLCYAVLGQIVNRDLRTVRARGEEAMFISGSHSPNPGDSFQTINSPIERPALAAAARADWGGATLQAHADSLRDDFQRPVPKPSPKDGMTNRALLWHYNTITRLLYYYPSLGTELAEAELRRTLAGPKTGQPPNPDEDTVSCWLQSRFVTTLAPFRSDRLQAALLDLFRQAASRAETDLQGLPPATWNPAVPSLGSDLALVCARRLAHQGHDDELKAFFTARVAAIEAATKASGPGNSLGSVNFVNQLQAGECRKFLAELESGVATSPTNQPTPVKSSPVTTDARVRLGPVTLTRNRGSSVKVTVGLVEPAAGRVFAGRVIIDKAKDDLGVTLWLAHTSTLAPVGVGRTSEAEMLGLPKASFEASLTRAAPQAKALTLLEGRVELVVPDFDPDAVVVVKDIAGKIGSPIESKALRAANMSITIHDRTTAREAEQSLQAGSAMTPETDAQKANNPYFQMPQYGMGDVVLSMSDPDERFLNVEFRDADGHSLRYNHNGWSHRSSGRGARSDVFRLGEQIPAGTQMVVWLRTEKSFVVVPLKTANLSLPEETVPGR